MLWGIFELCVCDLLTERTQVIGLLLLIIRFIANLSQAEMLTREDGCSVMWNHLTDDFRCV